MTSSQPIEIGSKTLTHKTCISDAIKVWNGIPNTLKLNKTLCTVKKVLCQNFTYIKLII